MGSLVNLDFERFVKTFVDQYLEQGSEAAGMYAISAGVDFWTDDEKLPELQERIKKEFKDRGFDLVVTDEEMS